MTDLRSIVADTMANSLARSPDIYLTTAKGVLAALAAPANRDALVAWLVGAVDDPDDLIVMLEAEAHTQAEADHA